MQKYKEILDRIIETNVFTIEEDASLRTLRCKETNDYLNSVELDAHGWVANEMGLHALLPSCEYVLDPVPIFRKSHEQKNVLGSVNYLKYCSEFSKTEKITLLKQLILKDGPFNYAVYGYLGILCLSRRFLKISGGLGFGDSYRVIAFHLSKSDEDRYSFYEKAAFSKLPDAQSFYELGLMRMDGIGCMKDLDLAFYYFGGCYKLEPDTVIGISSLYQLSQFYLHGYGSIPKDLAKGYTYLLKAKRAGDSEAIDMVESIPGQALEFIESLLIQEKASHEKIKIMENLLAFQAFDINAVIKHEIKCFLI